MEFSRLADCAFPHLRKLKLPLLSGATSSVDRSMARFLEKHPTIQDLSWLPIGIVAMSPQSLPFLRYLRTGRQVIEILDGATSPRPLECLDIQSLDAQSLFELRSIDRMSLRKLKLHSFGALSSVHLLADVFPFLTWLSLPSHHLPPGAGHPASVSLVRP